MLNFNLNSTLVLSTLILVLSPLGCYANNTGQNGYYRPFSERVAEEKLTFPFIECVKKHATENQATYESPILISNHNREISNETIYAGRDDDYAIRCSNKTGVKLSNLTIYHANKGIDINNCDGIEILNVKLISLSAPKRGPHCVRQDSDNLTTEECLSARKTGASDSRVAVHISDSDHVKLTNIRSQQASTAIYIVDSEAPQVKEIIGFDIRGPFPRGQLVQFNKSHNFLLEDFSYSGVFNQSHAEDNINAYKSNYGKINRGVIDGNWSISGTGVITDAGSSDIEISNIDCNHIATSCISVWSGSALSNNITVNNIRSKNGTLTSRHGGKPSTNGLVIAAQRGATDIIFNDVLYINPGRPFVAYAPEATIINIRKAPNDFELHW